MQTETWIKVEEVIRNEIQKNAGIKPLVEIYQDIIKNDDFPTTDIKGKSLVLKFRTKDGVIREGYIYTRAIKFGENLYLPAWMEIKDNADNDYYDLASVTEWRYIENE